MVAITDTEVQFKMMSGTRNMIAIATASIVLYLAVSIIPRRVDLLALVREDFFNGEIWRLLTYQFVHLDMTHLLTNSVGLIVAVLLAIELKTLLTGFYTTYFTSGLLAILPLWIVVPFTALGASAAVYAGFGIAAVDVRRFGISPYLPVLLFVPVVIGKAGYQYLTCTGACTVQETEMLQAASHLMGFIFGILCFITVMRIVAIISKRKQVCLRAAGGHNGR